MKDIIDFKAFRKDFDKAVEELGKRYGISLKAENITYDSTSFTMKVKAVRTDIDAEKEKFMSDLEYMSLFGFTEEDYKKEITYQGKKYKITGFKPGNKYNVLAMRDDGKTFGLLSNEVLKALGRK